MNSDTVPSKSTGEEFGMTTSNTKSPLSDKENSHAALIQPVQDDVGP